ncbi:MULTISPECIES: transglycosylase domain-containing protein [Shewanella]|uniref:transglycosylase domain-containing protein n=1 Tax=Shewanella TaxID=22 RepID=UPI000C42F18C|nr:MULTISPECIES: transglycosylase domain-containing protein [Shewanella]NCQ44342.1 penicillin-binding protein [Shewanella frigidimarina]NCO71700.1 penicillin-binding protein [Shewanella vesiculosa]NCP35303.1 penicillin-binding protein [Shewanella vesiculosa]NCP69978.1 penicillin-binding protein [Shewanella vesiculosa]NCP73349.1 penicillin-binding protein [Shewanella vesiculosa]
MSSPNTDSQFDNYRPKTSPAKPLPVRRSKAGWLLIVLLLATAYLVEFEVRTSYYQSYFLHQYASKLTYKTRDYRSDAVIYPQYGPFDERHGYSQLPKKIARLIERNYQITQQVAFSPMLMDYTQKGFFPPYHEKAQSGLSIKDCRDMTVFDFLYPKRVYRDQDKIPDQVVNTLLFIENREMLSPEANYNPVVDWPRFVLAAASQVADIFGADMSKAGGSTLATQIEKFRHSNHGLTLSIKDKLLQIGSAIVRVYQQGESTVGARHRIVQDYLNTVPLSSAPGFGEVHGIGDGLWAWFKTDFNQANQLLLSRHTPQNGAQRGEVFRQIVALMIAQRRPSYYLRQGHDDLESLVDSYLRLLGGDGLIETQLMVSALEQKLTFNNSKLAVTNLPSNKGVNAVRIRTAGMLDLSLFDLDRYDLSIKSTFHGDLQQQVSDYLRSLAFEPNAQRIGLLGERLLSVPQLDKVLYSFTLYESTDSANRVRIQTDSIDQPFDINEGSKLELGSTAKLRVLATYLDIIAELQQRFSAMTVVDLRQVDVERKDKITRWVVDYLITTRDRNLTRMLDAALQREYSASPEERFFTGGGLHVFNNFNKKEDSRVPTLYQALQESINLPFVRLMQDIVNYSSSYNSEGSVSQLLRNDKDPRREEYLKAFAKREGSSFVKRFYRKYRHLTPEQRLDMFFDGIQQQEQKLTAVYRYLKPYDGVRELTAFLTERLPSKTFTDKQINLLYSKYGEEKFNLADQGYIARVHPLELWVLRYLNDYPQTELTQVLDDAQPQLQEVYRWLFRTRHQNARDVRIQVMLEVEAFLSIHQRWVRMGYPFDYMVPSLGSALGSSGDRPAALAELMGIIQNDGYRYPTVRIDQLQFAENTPYEVTLANNKQTVSRVMHQEVARALKRALANVVENGTARRLKGSLLDNNGQPVVMGGKTGTGDNRIATEIRNGRKVSSTAINRTATFVFYLGDHHFGTLTAFVPGEKADDFSFTSALPLQVLKGMMPILAPMINQTEQCQTGL